MRFWRKSDVADRGSIATDETQIVVAQRASETVVTVAGRVTIDSSPYLRSALLRLLKERRGAVVVIDMEGVTYLDTSAIATLLEALALARQVSVKLRLEGMRGRVRMLAEMTELATIFAAAGSEVVFS